MTLHEVQVIKKPTLHFFHCDQSGAPVQVTAHDGTVAWRARYDGWGRARTGGHDFNVSQSLRYQGQFCDGETGLYYNHHRYYDPSSGRFMTQDPIGLRGGINPYRYALNPNRWIDPLGLQGVNLNLAGPLSTGWASTFNHGPEFFSVLAHGNPLGVTGTAAGNYIPPSQLAQTIRNTPGYHQSQTVVLMACYAGAERDLANPGHSSYAQDLADELGQPVTAPTGKINSGSYNGVGFVYNEGNSQWMHASPTPYTLTVL